MGRARHAFNFDSFLGTGLCRSGKPPMTRVEERKYDLLETTIAGSLPKPAGGVAALAQRTAGGRPELKALLAS
jgi:hypothetical protein